MLTTVNGLVARSYPSGDHDRVIHLLTEDRGRLAVMVKGGGSSRGAIAHSCTQLFTYGNYELYRGKKGDIYWLRTGSVLSPFYELSTDIARMALATYLCDVAADLTPEGEGDEEGAVLLRMLLNSLYVLCRGDKPLPQIKAVFELRAVSLMGYCPDLTGCGSCGESDPADAYLDILNGCLLCADCRAKSNCRPMRGILSFGEPLQGGEEIESRPLCPVSPSVLAAMRFILSASEKRIFSFAMKDEEEERGLERAAETFLLHQLEKEYETLRFYRSVAD